jgi:hypothetical protein
VARFGHTLVRETTGHAGVPWWGDLPDHRRPGKDEWSGWDESAEGGPDEGPPYVGRGTGIPYDQHFDNPATGPYPGRRTRAEPDPRDLDPSTSWITIRKTAKADPNPLLGCGPLTDCVRGGVGLRGLGEVPWYGWVIGIGAIAGLLYYANKRGAEMLDPHSKYWEGR